MPILMAKQTVKNWEKNMPCNEDASWRREEIEKSNMVKMLCSACRVLARLEYDFDENPMLSKWWDKHKIEDKKNAEKM